jgi:hypothetical protein
MSLLLQDEQASFQSFQIDGTPIDPNKTKAKLNFQEDRPAPRGHRHCIAKPDKLYR